MRMLTGKRWVTQMRKIIDELVNSRKYNNVEAYTKMMSMPIALTSVKSPKNNITLDKPESPKNMNVSGLLTMGNMLRPTTKDPCKIIIRGKEYTVTEEQFTIIKAIILSSISCSEEVGRAYADAVTDWLDNNTNRYNGDETTLEHYVYTNAFEALQTILNLEPVTVKSAISKMSGE